MQGREIPHFFLYGEPPQDVGDRFLHVENLETRSRPSNWLIRAHSHRRLHHAIIIRSGGGQVDHDGQASAFSGPCALLTPARCVHGFAFSPATVGWVATVSEVYLEDLARRDPIASAAFARPRVAPLEEAAAAQILEMILRLERELAWRAPGHDLMVEALISAILVDLARYCPPAEDGEAARPDLELVACFRRNLEASFRRRFSVGEHARALGVSESRLRAACRKATGLSPVRLATERVMAEARRILLYTSMTIAETAESLGFEDPAYFSRVFTQTVGQSPREYRQGGAAGAGGGAVADPRRPTTGSP